MKPALPRDTHHPQQEKMSRIISPARAITISYTANVAVRPTAKEKVDRCKKRP